MTFTLPSPAITIDRYDLERACDAAVSAYINGLAPTAPPLEWSLRLKAPELSGHITINHADQAAVAEHWRALLALDAEQYEDGVRTLTGHTSISGLGVEQIEIWYVADRDVWEARMELSRARRMVAQEAS